MRWPSGKDDGHGVSNARASLLVKILKAERDVTSFAPSGRRVAARCAASGRMPLPDRLLSSALVTAVAGA
jgi:hypothetical protein